MIPAGQTIHSPLAQARTPTMDLRQRPMVNGQDAAWIDNLDLPNGLIMTNPEVTDYGTHRDHDDAGTESTTYRRIPLDGSETADFDGDGIGDNGDLAMTGMDGSTSWRPNAASTH